MLKKRYTLLFLGDSLTEFFDWESRFPEHLVFNSGVAGETVQGLIRRLGRILSSSVDPDLVFLMTGANNLAMEDFAITGQFREVVASLRSGFPRATIVVQSIVPMTLSWIDNRAIDKLNLSLKQVAEEAGAVYLDLYRLFVDAQGSPI
ncbi:MAG TPA: GDSL-type esterase/lipase family protein, partial [Dissulfurispiraceae bacterium]|nr:GDSL-type esterase/lipase family protein [Dissulfurispiraceae bacterium]